MRYAQATPTAISVSRISLWGTSQARSLCYLRCYQPTAEYLDRQIPKLSIL
ncbi:hypothetical protein [Moorena sp. SIO2C4]|uniref:hypothetical protein n=1 Tax=Moorena sp. SIO2C4 TaxID=2607824 RepID=UPI0013012C01|nr:hypothetical protein [Moorena sp. SIO2C4]